MKDSTFIITLLLLTDCDELHTPVNGKVDVPGGTTYGQTAKYSCLPGYDLQGQANVACMDNGLWSGTATCTIKGW